MQISHRKREYSSCIWYFISNWKKRDDERKLICNMFQKFKKDEIFSDKQLKDEQAFIKVY